MIHYVCSVPEEAPRATTVASKVTIILQFVILNQSFTAKFRRISMWLKTTTFFGHKEVICGQRAS